MGAVGDRRLASTARAHRRSLLAASALLLALVFAIWIRMQSAGALPGDRAATRWWENRHPAHTVAPRVLDFFSTLATAHVALVTVLVLAVIFERWLGRRWALLIVAASGVVVLNAALKQLFGPSPLWTELHRSGHNFPSGHVAYATALFGLLGVVAFDRRRTAITAICVVLIVLMGPARVTAQTHLLSDAIAGYAVGAAWLCALVAVGIPWADRLRP